MIAGALGGVLHSNLIWAPTNCIPFELIKAATEQHALSHDFLHGPAEFFSNCDSICSDRWFNKRKTCLVSSAYGCWWPREHPTVLGCGALRADCCAAVPGRQKEGNSKVLCPEIGKDK